jgi:hypothetical protein
MSRTDRNPTLKVAQAMKAIQRIPASQIALIAALPAAEHLQDFTQAGNVSCGGGPSDAVRGVVRRVKTPDWLEGRNRA